MSGEQPLAAEVIFRLVAYACVRDRVLSEEEKAVLHRLSVALQFPAAEADRLMGEVVALVPGFADAGPLDPYETYRQVFQLAMADETVSSVEQDTLEKVRQALGVSSQDHERARAELLASNPFDPCPRCNALVKRGKLRCVACSYSFLKHYLPQLRGSA